MKTEEILEEHKKAVIILKNLKENPPRLLIVEGGVARERLWIARYWCALITCLNNTSPCFECKNCRDIFEDKFEDIVIFNGTEDTIKIDDVRIIQRDKDILPRRGEYNFFLFIGAENLTPQAANSLLKVLEEPKDKNLFVLIVPHKKNLIPTILSRGFVLTLKWKPEIIEDKQLMEIMDKLTKFWSTGRGLFDILSKAKKEEVKFILLFIQHLIFESMYNGIENNMVIFFKKRVCYKNLWNITHVLEVSHKMLQSNVAPVHVFHWMALSLYEFFNVLSDSSTEKTLAFPKKF